ncbi:GntG family PLP-dependent aldolase [Dactylosporangium sp. NPDC050688]|uniref:threonine aldolase family protein n=1 Tax=Dactylosporangium sp. NPDC050688 TaxID=3157217 RepID=UPI0033DB8186
MTLRVDLRSDTVTRPSAGMRRAIAEADVGDDGYGEDPTVNRLQAKVAELFGHEAALLLPTGTMSNQVAVQSLVASGHELLTDTDAHLVTYEAGAAAAVGGISTRTFTAPGGVLDPAAVAAQIRSGVYFTVPTRAIGVEQTGNRAGGRVHPVEVLVELQAVADAAGVAVHCDGARIWNAHIAASVALHEYGRLFTTMSVCLSKGLGAPAGSLMLGSAELVNHARWVRKRLGGAMRQAGLLAAAGIYAIDHQLARLEDDHHRAAALAEALQPYGVVDPADVHTNIVMLDVDRAGWTADAYAAAATARGVLCFAVSARQVRLVCHMDVTDQHLQYAVATLTDLLAAQARASDPALPSN